MLGIEVGDAVALRGGDTRGGQDLTLGVIVDVFNLLGAQGLVYHRKHHTHHKHKH